MTPRKRSSCWMKCLGWGKMTRRFPASCGLLGKPIGIGATIVESAAPYRNARKCGQKRGLQIDLLVQTACTAYVVEVKWKKHIEGEIEKEVAEKIRRLPLRKGMTARPALVYCGEIDPQVEARGYFDALIPAEKLLR